MPNEYFDLLEIKWGDETLRARPIAWDIDITAFEFNPEVDIAKATKYETVCPKCGNGCSFMATDTKVECENCKASAELIPTIIVPTEKIENINELNNELDAELDKILEERDELLRNQANSPEDIIDSLTESIMNDEIVEDEKPKEVKKKKGK